MAPQTVNWAIYNSLPPAEAQYQLAHINDNKKRSIAAAYIVCVPIIFLAVIMRFVSRRIGRTSYGADDWIMVLGLVLSSCQHPVLSTRTSLSHSYDRFWSLQTVLPAYWVRWVLSSGCVSFVATNRLFSCFCIRRRTACDPDGRQRSSQVCKGMPLFQMTL